jgi:hypothetical protein
MKHKASVIFVLLLLISSLISGCLSDKIKDVLLEENHGIPGSLAMACLRSDKHTTLEFEIVYEVGYRPETSSINLLKERISEVCEKPSGIRFDYIETTFPSNLETWSADDVREQGWAIKDGHPHSSNTLQWQILFPSGTYEDDSVLGVAVDASTIAIFKDSVEEAEGFFGRPSAEEVENSVIIHEVGHLLGLVNLVYQSPRPHEDAEHPGHSNNEDSVMFWAIESTSLMNFITGNLPNEFDDDDLADLDDLKNEKITVTDQLWMP